jgi:hypothetical protein
MRNTQLNKTNLQDLDVDGETIGKWTSKKGREGEEWIVLARDNQCRAFVNTNWSFALLKEQGILD